MQTNSGTKAKNNQSSQRSDGHDVGYMGDGVNDIAALHEADVGISVDSAVDVAKDASDIILMKKSLGHSCRRSYRRKKNIWKFNEIYSYGSKF